MHGCESWTMRKQTPLKCDAGDVSQITHPQCTSKRLYKEKTQMLERKHQTVSYGNTDVSNNVYSFFSTDCQNHYMCL